MFIRRSFDVTVAAFCLSAPTATFAQQPKQNERPVTEFAEVEPIDRTDITIVLGAAVAPSYDGSDDQNVVPMVTVTGEIDRYAFSILGTAAQLDLVRDKPGAAWDIQFGPAIEINLNRTSGIGDTRVAALGTRKVAIEIGAQLGVARNGVVNDYDTLSLGATVVRDIADAHDSIILVPAISYSTPLSRRVYVSFEGVASLVGDGYARTYFDVDNIGASRSGLPRFSARGGWMNWSLSADALYSLSNKGLERGWGIAASVSYLRLLGDFARSPVTAIAGSRNQLVAGLGIAYSF